MNHTLEICIWVLAALLVFVRVNWHGARMPLIDAIVRRLAPSDAVIGFGPMPVAANSKFTFRANPVKVRRFAGQRLVVPSTLATNFAVVDILVDGESQMEGYLPAAAFSESAMGVRLSLRKTRKNSRLELIVLNTSDKDCTFSAALLGKKGLLA